MDWYGIIWRIDGEDTIIEHIVNGEITSLEKGADYDFKNVAPANLQSECDLIDPTWIERFEFRVYKMRNEEIIE